MINKLKGGHNMKTTNIVLTVFLIATLFGATFAAAAVGDIFSADTAAVSVASVASSISASDAMKTEIEIENEIEFETSTKNTVSKGQGWIVIGQKGALLEILFVSKAGTTSDGTVDSISKGWMKAGDLKLKIDSTSSTETSKKFAVTAEDGLAMGTLTLTRAAEVYQTGFSVWNGNLDLKVGDSPFNAKVALALEEKQSSGKGTSGSSGSGSSGKITSITNGILEIGGNSYTLVGESNKPQKLEFKVVGQQSDITGELMLESKDSKNYVGKIRVEGNDQDMDSIKGKVTATLSREGNTLYGPIRIELDGSAATDLAFLEGTIKIALTEKAAEDSKVENKDKSIVNDAELSKEDSVKSKSDSESSNKGFWKKFKEFFGN